MSPSAMGSAEMPSTYRPSMKCCILGECTVKSGANDRRAKPCQKEEHESGSGHIMGEASQPQAAALPE